MTIELISTHFFEDRTPPLASHRTMDADQQDLAVPHRDHVFASFFKTRARDDAGRNARPIPNDAHRAVDTHHHDRQVVPDQNSNAYIDRGGW